MKLLLIGSGLSAKQAKQWNIKNHFVGTINHAWRLYPEFDIAFYAGDLPNEDRPENSAYRYKNQLFVSDLVGPYRDQYTFNVCRHTLRLGNQSSLMMTLHWIIWYAEQTKLKLSRIGLIGCDLNYIPDENGHTHFYGIGKDIITRGIPDPFLDKTPDQIRTALFLIEMKANERNIEMVNYSDDPNTILPFKKVAFDD